MGPREGPVRAVAVVAGAVAGVHTTVPQGAPIGARPVETTQLGGGLPPQAQLALLGLRPLLHVGRPVAAPSLAGHEGEDAAGEPRVPVAPSRSRVVPRTPAVQVGVPPTGPVVRAAPGAVDGQTVEEVGVAAAPHAP